MPYVFNCEQVKTRKSHMCFGCERNFPANIYMEKQVVRDGRSLFSIYLCDTCNKLIDELLEPGEVYEQGEFKERALDYEKK